MLIWLDVPLLCPISLSKRLSLIRFKVGQSKVIDPIETVDTETGVITKKMPSIDVGWDYNVGKAWLAPEVILGQQLVNSTAMQLAKENSINQGLAQTLGA